MKKYIEITADTNDADYVSERTEITDEILELIMPVIQAIKDFKPYKVDNVGYDKKSTWEHDHNWPDGECCREDLGEKTVEELYGHLGEALDHFIEICPSDEYGIHTIESIMLLEVSNETKLL